MTAFDDELALERIEAELATELPAHMRAFAAAYAANQPSPPSPAVLGRPATIDLALRVLETTRGETSDQARDRRERALDILRLAIPLAIESDPKVGALRATVPTWDGYRALAAGRDAVAKARFGRGHIELLRDLHGRFACERSGAAWPAPLDGWHAATPPIERVWVERAWRDLATMHAFDGTCRLVASAARPRAFIVEPRREVVVVLGAIDTPAMRFAALHELGHACAGLCASRQVPRVADEAAASYTARFLEHEGALDLAWSTPLAAPARIRRRAIAEVLERTETGGPLPPIERPPWSLWHDPGAQTAYVEAEALADAWWERFKTRPAPTDLVCSLEGARREIDETTAIAIS
jgi:hypothetical protein